MWQDLIIIGTIVSAIIYLVVVSVRRRARRGIACSECVGALRKETGGARNESVKSHEDK